jgi:hypothetical protein
MRKFRLFLKLLGVVAIFVGFSSCKKDKKDDSCITCTYNGVKDTVCETDDSWKDYADTWQDYVDIMKLADAVSDNMTCN